MSKKVVYLIIFVVIVLCITLPSWTKCETSETTSSLGSYDLNNINYGTNDETYSGETLYVTSKSSININIGDSMTTSYSYSGSHALISNILLPKGTNMTLIDNINNRVYEYSITTEEDNYSYESNCSLGNCKAIYPFSLFKENGKSTTSNYVEESTISSEEFNIIVNFEDTSITQNYTEVKLYVELLDSSNNVIKTTLESTIKTFDIYYNSDASLSLNTSFEDSVNYNSVSSYSIPLTSGVEYKIMNNQSIYDTTYENKKMGLAISVVNQNGNVVGKEYYKNISFKYDDKVYYPGSDSVTRIKISNLIEEIKKTIVIQTYGNNSSLEDGTYYIKISNYVSYDGYSYDELESEVLVPLIVLNKPSNSEFSFDVTSDNNYIISRNNTTQLVNFNILQSGELLNPNIKISLYKKDELTAYNQDYSIIDLKDFIKDDLEKYEENIYYAVKNAGSSNEFELTFDAPLLENTGYKLVFDLYDGTQKIETIQKYFVVK